MALLDQQLAMGSRVGIFMEQIAELEHRREDVREDLEETVDELTEFAERIDEGTREIDDYAKEQSASTSETEALVDANGEARQRVTRIVSIVDQLTEVDDGTSV
ncbi:hypothetical protein [Natrialba sp. INN-245]|uniref:hypothetical protein n=1 Tax=Natrialba sp. INN-245 TaxID=2690967 RepID=UPI0013102E1A|nr:hypothetical protein [Natrialba sp. INN-245]MWV40294.1 hypothetical protein [Natrialba sp. INN-245]